MSHHNDTPNMGGRAYVRAQQVPDLEFRTVGVSRDSYAGINEWSGGLLGPFLFSIVPILTMGAMSLWFVAAGVFNWSGSVLEKTLTTVAIYLGIALFTYWPYRVISMSIGSLTSAITFAYVVDRFPLPELVLYTYCAMICSCLVASVWASEVKS